MSAPDEKTAVMLREHGIHFKRIAINDYTIETFGMEVIKEDSMNDRKTQIKLDGSGKKKGDPNTPWFKYI